MSSRLMLLADIAITDHGKEKEPSTVEVGVQTDGHSQVHVEKCQEALDHSVHDYLKTADFDLLVNSTHDYYNRVDAPELDCEHSYAFPVPSSCQKNGEGVPSALDQLRHDDLVEEDVANLDSYMEMEAVEPIFEAVDSQEVFEEIILSNKQNDDDLSFSGGLSPRSDFGDILAAVSKHANDDSVDTIIEVGDAEFENLLEYLTAGVSDFESAEMTTDDPSNIVVVDQTEVEPGTKKLSKLKRNNRRPATKSRAKSVKSSKNVKRHRDSVVCSWEGCEWWGRDAQALGPHVENSHLIPTTVNTPWLCKWKHCSRLTPFSRRYMLARHMRTHTLERPYECCVCGKSFAIQDKLTIHERTHSGQRPYSCSVCPKSFSSSGERRRHVFIKHSK